MTAHKHQPHTRTHQPVHAPKPHEPEPDAPEATCEPAKPEPVVSAKTGKVKPVPDIRWPHL